MLIESITLFAAAFLAATILPFSSEVYLFALLERGGDPYLLVAVATLGNTLGAMVNWLLGLYLLRFKDRQWFYFSEQQIARAQRWYQKAGYWSLLLAWLPVGGDALTLVAGIMRLHWLPFLVLVGVGKAGRYIAVVYLSGWFF